VLDCRGTPVHLYGIAYDPARTRNPWGAFRRREEGGIHVALVHGSLEGNPEWEMRNRDLPIPLSAIRESGMDYVALGHYHDFHEGREGGTVWCYPGTLEGLKWGEWGERFLVSVSIEPSAAAGAPRVRVVKTPYPGRRIVECDLDLDRTGIATADALAKEILARATEAAPSPSGPRAPGDLIVRVVLRGTRPAAIDLGRLRARLADELFHVAFDDRLRSHDPAIRELARSERTVRGIFVRRMEERLEGAADEAARARLELALRLGLEALEEEEGTLPAPDPAAARAGPGPGGPRAH
jgi:DNA repair exonuclease SbcCD nuclease subunit